MSIIWLLIVLVMTPYCLMTGDVGIINDILLNAGKETLDLVISLLCATCSWNGILYITRGAGIIHGLEWLFHPPLEWLFPDLKDDEEILGYVATNAVVNMVGLDSAATPVGSQAMKGTQWQNPGKDTASRSMTTLLVLNTTGVTLLLTTLIALQASFHSLYVAGSMPYAIVSTLFASAVGLSVDRWWNYHD